MVEKIKRAFYDAPSGQIMYRYILASTNKNKAPVVFMHQSPSCGRCYESIMKEYAERGHDCYAPDMPGSIFYSFFLSIKLIRSSGLEAQMT